MLCCVCKKKEATVHLTQVANDQYQKVDLCEECAKAKGVNDPMGFSLADLLLGLGANQESPPSPSKGLEPACPRCGFTQADFKKTGRLGCPECYTAFQEPLSGLLKTMHKGTRHVGKTPLAGPTPVPAPKNEDAPPAAPAPDMSRRIKQLQDKLAKAIQTEDFEQAAKLRDELKALNSQPGKPASA